MIEETISLKDMVTGPAKEMLEGVIKLHEGIESMRGAFEEGGGGIMQFVGGLSQVTGGVGMAVGPLMEMGKKIGEVGIELGALAIESVEAKEEMLSMFASMTGSKEAGESMFAMVDGLASKLPQSRKQIGDWSKQFMAMGQLDQGALQENILATANAQALMGDKGAQAYTNLTKKILAAEAAHTGLKIGSNALAKQLTATGVSSDDIAKLMGMSTQSLAAKLKAGTIDAAKFGDALNVALKNKGGPALENMADDMSTMKAKFTENIGKLFEGVDVGPFKSALAEVGAIFGQSTATGQGMKAGITAVFSKMFAIVGKVIHTLKTLTLDLVILGLKGYIAIKPMIRWIQEMNEKFGLAGKIVLAVKVGLGVMAVVVGVVVAAVAILVAAVVGIGLGLMALTGTIESFVGDALGALAGWASAGWTIAGDFIDGLIGGITTGVGAAVDAVKNLGSSVLAGVKGVLGIHSPSIEMMNLGGYTAEGFATGIAGGTGDVRGAASAMAGAANDNAISSSAYQGKPGAAGSNGAAGAPGGGGNNGASVTFMPGSIVINGAGKDAAEITEEMLATVLERVANSQGA